MEIIMLAAATSADIFAAAIGIRAAGIRFSALSAMTVILTGAAALWLSVFAAAAASDIAASADGKIPVDLAVYVSKAILIFIGIRTVFGDVSFKHKKKCRHTMHIAYKHELPGCVRMMTDPACADADNSKTISCAEGAVMGLALSADSVFTGISAGIAGMSPCLIFLFSVIFGSAAMASGSLAGKLLTERNICGFPAGRIGGIILIVLAVVI